MKLNMILAGLALATMATPASAAITVTRVGDAYNRDKNGDYIYPANADVTFLNYLNTAAEQSQVTGKNFQFMDGASTPEGAEPFPGRNHSNNEYLSVLGGGYATFTLTDAQRGINTLFIDIGSIDDYNDLQINFGAVSGLDSTFSGTELMSLANLPGSANGDQTSRNTNGRFMFSGVQGITSITFRSSQNSFEVDNIAGAVPEPATWAMMIGGFGLVGGAMRRRSATATTVLA